MRDADDDDVEEGCGLDMASLASSVGSLFEPRKLSGTLSRYAHFECDARGYHVCDQPKKRFATNRLPPVRLTLLSVTNHKLAARPMAKLTYAMPEKQGVLDSNPHPNRKDAGARNARSPANRGSRPMRRGCLRARDKRRTSNFPSRSRSWEAGFHTRRKAERPLSSVIERADQS